MDAASISSISSWDEDERGSGAPLKARAPGYGAAKWRTLGDVARVGIHRNFGSSRRYTGDLEPYDPWKHGRITRRLRPIIDPIFKFIWDHCGAILLLVLATFFLMFAEVIIGLCEAVPMKVMDAVIPTDCAAKERNDHHLVQVTCPVLYLPDFRNVVRGTFVENVSAGIDLRGVSISLQTEIYQWVEYAVCDGCDGEEVDEKGHCLYPLQYHPCKYSFSKMWVPRPVSSNTFHCQEHAGRHEQEECDFPVATQGRPKNVGTIPLELASFRRFAEDGSVSIGDYPARFYLSLSLIEQLPVQSTPLFFKSEALPTIQGYVTTASDNTLHKEIRLEQSPGSPEPTIGDLRTRLELQDFYNRDRDKFVSVVAKQVPWTTTENHRKLIPWKSRTRSWTNTSEVEVQWLDEGPHSLGDMVEKRRSAEYEDANKFIVSFRIIGILCMLFGFLLFEAPLAEIWLGMRHWISWRSGALDIGMLLCLFSTSTAAFVLFIVSFPWLHFEPLRALILMISALLSLGMFAGLLYMLDTKDNLRHVLDVSRSQDQHLATEDRSPEVSMPESLIAEVQPSEASEARV